MVGSRKLKLLALSDTHLGEETSLLSFPRGLQHLWHTLREDPGFWKPVFPDFEVGERVEVEELVLLGDIADRTLSSTSQISAHSHAFAMMLGDALDVKKAVYVPGNHDHTLWTAYHGSPGVTGPEGKRIAATGGWFEEEAEELLSIFFGYPTGWAWWTIKDRERSRGEFSFWIANPMYATEIAGRTYALAHGTHFRSELYGGLQQKILHAADVSRLDRLLDLDLQRGGEASEAQSMTDLEERISPFVDSLWPSSKNAPTSRSDELWYLFTLLREGSAKGRVAPQTSEIFPAQGLNQVSQERVERLTDANGEPTDGSLKRFRDHFLEHLRSHLREANLSSEDLTFVYGDTHRGGWGDLAVSGGRDTVRVYNCGGWIVEGRKTHPACHLFAVDEEGGEYLFDLSFEQDSSGEPVKIGDDTLLCLAGEDLEHRRKAVNKVVSSPGEIWRSLSSFVRRQSGA